MNFVLNARRALSPFYAMSELLWYVNREQSVERLVEYAPQYKNFAEADGNAYGAYGHRIGHNVPGRDQLDLVVHTLRSQPSSRQCVVSLWRPDDLVHAYTLDKKDLPCTLTWQFILRSNGLHMIANMRSNDAWLGLPYDAYVNTCFMGMIAQELGVPMLTYTHQAGSMHLYDKNLEAAEESLRVPTFALPNNYMGLWKQQELRKLAAIEQDARRFNLYPEPFAASAPTCDMWHVIEHWHDMKTSGSLSVRNVFHSPALAKGMELYADHRRSRLGG